MSIDRLAKTHPEFHQDPPIGLYEPFLRVGGIPWDDGGSQPPLGEVIYLVDYQVISSEILVLESIEVRGALFPRIENLDDAVIKSSQSAVNIKFNKERTIVGATPDIRNGAKSFVEE